jgi:HK97 family phage major capsid protein
MRHTTDQSKQFSDLGTFLQATVQFGINGSHQLDPRLKMEAVAGLNEGIPSEGGFAVPDQFAQQLWSKVYDTGRILSRCERQPITVGDRLSIPAIDERSRSEGSRFGGARMFWSGEGQTPPPSKPKFSLLTLQPTKLLGLCYSSGELAADAPALASWFLRVFGQEAAFSIEDRAVVGQGTNGPLGILNSAALIMVDPESGQAPGSVTPANLTQMAARLWGPSHRRAAWMMGNEAFAQVADVHFANGTPVLVSGSDGGLYILGMPLELSEYTPALGSTGDVLLADWSQYLIGEKAPEYISSIHVRFLQDELAFRLRYRVDGQPAWAGFVLPRNSTVTQSPFIALAARE